jgi:4-alpha-glucanotransferase
MARPSVTARCAGFALPLFSLRREHDVGIGEILDLIPLVEWAAGFGQRVIQLLPINETDRGEASPYNALSAFAIDPVYVHVEGDVVAGPASGAPLARDAVRDAKLRALARSWDRLGRTSSAAEGFDAFKAANRDWLDDYATFRALKEEQGGESWEEWPAALRDRERSAVAEATRRLAERVEFLRYVQWVADDQWRSVRRRCEQVGVWLKGDLPFVISRDSADVWAHPDEFDAGYSVGAPPDDFSATGQSWGLPMYNWACVRQTDFAWWRRRVTQARSLYDLYRIDHIIGFFRTYAIPHQAERPSGFVPADEPGQREQGEAFLQAVQDASDGTLPMAEDLGSVPPWVRQILHRRGIPGYKVFRWERDDHRFRDPRQYDAVSVATTGTHDTDTLVEWWAGLPRKERESALHSLHIERRHAPAGLGPRLRQELLAHLYEAGSAFVIPPIQDLFGWTGRVNVPATPSLQNWNWRLPLPIERLAQDHVVRRTARTLRKLVTAAGR